MGTERFFGGVPTKPEVDKLLALFRSLKEGDQASYGDITNYTGLAYGTNRFTTVVMKARREFARETSVTLVAVPGVGLSYPTGREQLKLGANRVRVGARTVRRGTEIAAMVNDARLDAPGRAARDAACYRMLALSDFARTEARKIQMIAIPTEVQA